MDCEICLNYGAVIIFNDKEGHLEIQRCDTCMKFKSDLEAWKHLKPNTSSERSKIIALYNTNKNSKD